jgi:hypothetical protein
MPSKNKANITSQFQPFSQENSLPENVEEEDICSVCNEKR